MIQQTIHNYTHLLKVFHWFFENLLLIVFRQILITFLCFFDFELVLFRDMNHMIVFFFKPIRIPGNFWDNTIAMEIGCLRHHTPLNSRNSNGGFFKFLIFFTHIPQIWRWPHWLWWPARTRYQLVPFFPVVPRRCCRLSSLWFGRIDGFLRILVPEMRTLMYREQKPTPGKDTIFCRWEQKPLCAYSSKSVILPLNFSKIGQPKNFFWFHELSHFRPIIKFASPISLIYINKKRLFTL